MKTKREIQIALFLIGVFILLIVLFGLAEQNHTYHFSGGLWHGSIFVISFIIFLFHKGQILYACNNNGWPYNLGFVLATSSLAISKLLTSIIHLILIYRRVHKK